MTGAVSAFACGEAFTVVCGPLGLFAWGKNSHVINTEDLGARFFAPVALAGPGSAVRALASGTWHAAALLEGGEPPATPLPPVQPTAPLAARQASPDGVVMGMKRERTTITLAELYAPTPTPMLVHGKKKIMWSAVECILRVWKL